MVHDFHHARIGGDVDLAFCLSAFSISDHIQRLIGELIEGIRSLFVALAVTKKQDAFYRASIISFA
jgi:predicted transcriptional regulator